MGGDEGVELRLELGCALADRPCDVGTGPQSDVGVNGETREDLLPELRHQAIDHQDLDQTGVRHFEQVFVLELAGREAEHGFGLVLAPEALVERGEALVHAAALTHEDLLPGEIVELGDRRRAGPGDDDLARIAVDRRGEVDQLQALGSDCQSSESHVSLSGREVGKDAVA
jgi:hypothetical protein